MHEELKQLTNAMHDLKQDRKVLKKEAEDKHLMEHFWKYFHLLLHAKEEIKQTQIGTIMKQLTMKLDLDTKETKWSRKIIERYYEQFKLDTIYHPNEFNRKTQITESDKGP